MSSKDSDPSKPEQIKVRIADSHTPLSKSRMPMSRVTVNFDVGFSNAVYIRGQGSNLRWDAGILLKNVKADEWVWETNEPFHHIEFKVLINDQQFESGANHVLTPGASIRYTPLF